MVRAAYAFLGLLFLILISGSFYALDRYEARKNMTFRITSPVFKTGNFIPQKYTCDGDNVSPPLVIEDIPKETKSLVLLVDDPDVPKQLRPDGVFDHWVVYSLPPDTTEIAEGAVLGAQGLNGRGSPAYTGPCPPTEYEPTTHRYFFKLYALSGMLNFAKAPTKHEVEQAMQGMIVGETELIGLYDRAK